MQVGVQRALILLQRVAESREGAGVRELARSLGYNPSAVQKNLDALLSQGFVSQDPDTRRYHLGLAAIRVGLAGLARLDVRHVGRPHLEALAEATGETAMLGVRHEDVVIYIDKALVPAEMRVDVILGARRPFNCTAVGKVLLAFLPDEDFERLAEADAFVSATPHSITEPEALRRELVRVRDQGYAIDREEFHLGWMCVAAPVRNHDGAVAAAVTIAGPAQRVDQALETVTRQVVKYAGHISAALGYQG